MRAGARAHPHPPSAPAPGSPAWWQARAQRTRRASALTAERIVDTAIGLLDAEGLAAFSMRRLADGLGTAPGSLYRHFESRDAVLVAVHDRLIGEGIDFDPSGETWAERMVNLVRSEWRTLQQRPYLASIWSSTEQLGPNALRARERALQLVLGSGIPRELAARAYLSVLHFTIAFATLQQGFRLRTPERRADTEAFFRTLPEADYPATRKLAADLAHTSLEDEFELVLQAAIAGVQSLMDQHGGAGPARR